MRGMYRPVIAIIAVCVVEACMRLIYPHFMLNGLVYTLIARALQLAIILGMCWNQCGIKTASLRRELMIGVGIAVGFGSVVVLIDALSRWFISDGVVLKLIGYQPVKNPLLYFVVGCVFAPLVEELFFRGLIYSWIRQTQRAFVAVIISAVLFASMHGFLSPVQLIGGIAFASVYEWRRSIWAAYVLHSLANTGIWLFPVLYSFIAH